MTCLYPEESPLMVLAQGSDGCNEIYINKALPSSLQNKIRSRKFYYSDAESADRLICSEGIRAKSEHFKTCIFPESYFNADTSGVKCLMKDDPAVIAFGFHGFADRVYTIENDGVILSACTSVRQNLKCAEAWVFTAPEHRGKGYARRVAAAWAGSLMAESIIPFYSHDVKNIESHGLTSRLKLNLVFDEIVINTES